MARGFTLGTAILLAALSALGGCSVIGGQSVSCPSVNVLDGAGNMTRFKEGGQRDLTDVEFEAQVARLEAECSFDDETRAGAVDLDIVFRMQRGPAGEAGRHAFEYFVALVDPDGGVAARQAFPVEATFAENERQLTRTEPLALNVPTKEGAAFPAYRVYVGMELTREQFDDNIGRR